MADDKPITDEAAEARLGVALEALGTAPGLTPLADTALKGARQVLLAFKLALLSRSELEEPERSAKRSAASSERRA